MSSPIEAVSSTMTADIDNDNEETKILDDLKRQHAWTDDDEIVGVTEVQVVLCLLALFSVFGVSGNALALYVFARKKDQLVSTVFIMALAFVDFIVCLLVIPYAAYMEYVGFVVESDMPCKVYWFLVTSNIPYSALIMVAIAVDRYFCICHPWRKVMNVRRARFVVVSLGVFAVALGVCVAMMYGVYHPLDDGETWRYITTNIYEDTGEASRYTEASSGAGTNDSDAGRHLVSGSDVTGDDNRKWNSTVQSSTTLADDTVYVNTGFCDTNEMLLSYVFQAYYQKVHMSVYVICFFVIAVLYVAIFQSILNLRNRRKKRRLQTMSVVVATSVHLAATASPKPEVLSNGDEMVMSDLTTTAETVGGMLSGTNSDSRFPGMSSDGKHDGRPGSSVRRHQQGNLHLANVKTAAMLFVVTVVFMVTFLPAYLIALHCIPYNMTAFYMYFANNVANPVIYSFMNKNFRTSLKALVCARRVTASKPPSNSNAH